MNAAVSRPAEPVRLYCLPYAGGSAQMFGDWSADLPDWLTVLPLELPGRGCRFDEDPVDQLEPVVADLMGTVLSGGAGRFAVLGHSYGALLAYELCRRLEHYHGLVAEHLFAVAMRAPTVPRAGIRVSDLSGDALREYLRALGGTPPEVLAHDLLMELLLPVLRADLMVVDDYVCRGLPVTCPVTALGGRDDAQVSPAALSAWGHCTHGPFRVRMFPGGHFFPRTEREALLSLLAGELAAVADRRPDPAQEPGMSLRSQA